MSKLRINIPRDIQNIHKLFKQNGGIELGNKIKELEADRFRELNESPDFPRVPDDKTTNIPRYYHDGGAYAFGYNKKGDLFTSKEMKTHFQIHRKYKEELMRNVKKSGKQDKLIWDYVIERFKKALEYNDGWKDTDSWKNTEWPTQTEFSRWNRNKQVKYIQDVPHWDWDWRAWYDQAEDDANEKLIEKEFQKLNIPEHRDSFTYPGRIWTKSKHLSFWKYPKKDKMKSIIKELEKEFNIQIFNQGWTIDIKTKNGEIGIYLDDYTGSKARSAEELAKLHAMPPGPEKDALLKKLGVKRRKSPTNKGIQRYKTAIMRRGLQPMYEETLNENPDRIDAAWDTVLKKHISASWREDDAIAFGQFKNQMFTISRDDHSMPVHYNIVHVFLRQISDKEPFRSMLGKVRRGEPLTDKEKRVLKSKDWDPFQSYYDKWGFSEGDITSAMALKLKFPTSRDKFKYPGRLWKNQRIISFWEYPPKSEFKKVISRLEKAIGKKMWGNKWRIEIINDGGKFLDPKNKNMFWTNSSDKQLVLIPLESYIGSGVQRGKDKGHVVSPIKKAELQKLSPRWKKALNLPTPNRKNVGMAKKRYLSRQDEVKLPTFIKTAKDLIKSAPPPLRKRIMGLKNVQQNTKHHPEGNVLKHTILVVQNALKRDDIDLAISALLHDVGKDVTTKIHPKKGTPTAPGHEKESAKLAKEYREWIRSLGGNPVHVMYLIKQHMRVKYIDDMRPYKQNKLKNYPIYDKLQQLNQDDIDGRYGGWKNSNKK